MFSDTVSLDAKLHREILFSARQPYHHCRMEVSTPVMANETSYVAREMPILFSSRSPTPMALLGVEVGENLHVRPTGHWIGRYIPAHFRRYPFILAPIEAPPGADASAPPRFAVKFARQAPHLRDGGKGQRLFDEGGQPTEALKRVQQALLMMQQQALHTSGLVRELERHKLLVARSLTVTPKGGKAKRVEGFRMVDDAAFKALSPQVLSELQASGALALIYAHHVSLTNLQDGVIAQMQSDTSDTPDARDLDSLFGANDDISFNFDS